MPPRSFGQGQFKLSTNVLAYDTTNFDTHIATTTDGELAKRGHAKSKRSDLRVVGLGLLASETGHVPLLHRTYPGNGSDQTVLGECLDALGRLHDAMDDGQGRRQPAARTLVRDGGFWSEQLELELELVGYYSIISLPLGHGAARWALDEAAKPRAMRLLTGKYKQVRAARFRRKVGDELDRTLVVVESKELLEGQKRGIKAALVKAREELAKLELRVAKGKILQSELSSRVKQLLKKEHLAAFVVTEIGGDETSPTFTWRVDAKLRRQLEQTDSVDAYCARTSTTGLRSASCTASAASGTSRRCSAGPREGESCRGGRRISGPMRRLYCTALPPCWG